MKDGAGMWVGIIIVVALTWAGFAQIFKSDPVASQNYVDPYIAPQSYERASVPASYDQGKQDYSYPSTSFDCTNDCSGHEAGFKWAEENGISDPSDCGGNSNSFIEGCEAYAEENHQGDSYEEDSEDSYYRGDYE